MVPPLLHITRFDLKPSFSKDVKRLGSRERKNLKTVLDELKSGNLLPVRQLKKLAGSDGVYSIRVGNNYRLSFELDGQVCILRRIGPRQKFYDSY